jgi:hypothetical protein
MRVMPTMPYLPRVEDPEIGLPTDEEIAFALYVFEEQQRRA